MTPNGYKSSRYGDARVSKPETNEDFIVQVGKQTKSGRPISREMNDITYLENVGAKVIFIPYN